LLPGSHQAYRFATKTWEDRGSEENPHVPVLSLSGRLAAATSSAADLRRAEGFVIWLAGREVSQQVGPHSAATALFRNSQIATSNRWTGLLSPEASRQYADTLSQTLSLPRAFPSLTLPSRHAYLAALDDAVEMAFDTPPAQILADVAKKWKSITDSVGVEAQRRANERSLGQGNR